MLMSTDLSQRSSSPPTLLHSTSVLHAPQDLSIDVVIGSSMKRLLGVNDGYGSREFREIIMDGMNGLRRGAETSEGFVTRIATLFEDFQGKAKETGMAIRPRVMREALLSEQAYLTAVVVRMRDG